MNSAVRSQLRRFRRKYRRHMAMQNLKGHLLDHEEGKMPPLALGALVVTGVVGGLVAGFFVLSCVFSDD